jgi:hypothetical protein
VGEVSRGRCSRPRRTKPEPPTGGEAYTDLLCAVLGFSTFLLKYKKYWCSYCIIYGYENDKYFCINGYNPEEIICSDQYFELIFVKDKKMKRNFSESYKHVVMNIPSYIKMPETKEYSFGRQAFIDWGNSF